MLVVARLGLAGLIVLCCLAMMGRAWIKSFHEQRIAVVTLNVPSGWTASEVLKELAPDFSPRKRALIFSLYPQYTYLQMGRYEFQFDTTVVSALNKIHRGEALLERLTIPEGIMAKDLLGRIEKHQALVGAVSLEFGHWSGLVVDWPSHEGAFLAETYLWQQALTRDGFLQQAHKALNVALDRAWRTADPIVATLLESPYELLILASIVEKETALEHERSKIAGVFLERLKRKMRLQTDPTVIYGLGDRFDGNITRNHLREFTPYNTYRINGLPPTPIALVGPDALMAVARPEFTGDLYFVADGSGGHVFSRTLEVHNANVRKYQLE